MTVIVAEKVGPGLRGLVSRWMLEVHPGVFVGTLSARVRDQLWATITKPRRRKVGSFLLVYSVSGEQRFQVVSFGSTSRAVFDYDGLQLTGRLTPAAPSDSAGGGTELAVRSPEERARRG